MYLCDNCGLVFDTPKRYEERHNLDSPPYEQLEVCPECGSTEFDEAIECDRCGEVIRHDEARSVGEASHVCENCYDEMFR